MSDEADQPQPGKVPLSQNWPLAFGVVGSIVLVIIVWSLLAGGKSTPDQHRDDPLYQQIDAERYCKAEVAARLKAPATAEWSNVNATGLGPFTVTGVVDSENSFGAMLRNSWSCAVTLVGGSWHLDDIEVVH